MQYVRIIVVLFVSFFVVASPALAALSATQAVERAENLLWGKTVVGESEMTITTPTWSRTMSMRMWADLPSKSFMRITAPRKDAGISSLRVGSEMWNYVPAIERTIKIPPSMMLQPWLGSDFTNDDLAKESSLVNDYTHRFLEEKNIDGHGAYRVEATPKPNAAIVWGKVIYTIRKTDLVPVSLEFYDERGELIRVLTYFDIRSMGGRTIPTRWEMRPLNKPGKRTTIVIKSMSYDKPMNAEIFSLRNLTNKE